MAYDAAQHRPVRPRQRLRAALSLAGAVVVLCAVGAAGVGVWSYQSVRGDTAAVRAAAERFLDRLVATDPAGAYGQLCPATRRRWSPSQFTRAVHTPPRIVGYTVRDVTVAARSDQPSASVTTRLVHESGPPRVRVVPMVADGDTWRVCGDPF